MLNFRIAPLNCHKIYTTKARFIYNDRIYYPQ